MRIAAKASLDAFGRSHPTAREPLSYWYHLTKGAHWQCMEDVKGTFGSADPINASRVVFNIHGNDFRLIADIFFPKETVFVKFIGTHKEYDRVDAATVDDF